MTYNFTVNRADGERTDFRFTEDNITADIVWEQLKDMKELKDLKVPEERVQRNVFMTSEIYKNSINGSDVNGVWQASDADAAAVDI